MLVSGLLLGLLLGVLISIVFVPVSLAWLDSRRRLRALSSYYARDCELKCARIARKSLLTFP